MVGIGVGVVVMLARRVAMGRAIPVGVKLRRGLAIPQRVLLGCRLLRRGRWPVRVERRPREVVRAAERLVAAGGVAVAAARAVLQPPTDPLDVVMVALLPEADLGFETQHLLAI